jgi:hypothetical protein
LRYFIISEVGLPLDDALSPALYGVLCCTDLHTHKYFSERGIVMPARRRNALVSTGYVSTRGAQAEVQMDYDGSRPIRLKAPDSYKFAEVYSSSLGTLVLSESRTVVMLACFANDLLKSKWTEVEPAPDLSEVASSQVRSREKQRQARFHRFEKYHYGRNQWIAFKRIAEWQQRAGRPPYDGLVASIHAGRFERGGKSQILFMSRAAIVAPSCVPANIKGCLRFSAADFRAVDHVDQDVLEAAYLSRFWIPRAVCEQWFREEEYELPPWLAETQSTAVAQVSPTATKSDRTPKRFSPAEAEKAYSRRRAQLGETMPTRDDDKEWAKAEGYSQKPILELRNNYKNRTSGQKKPAGK